MLGSYIFGWLSDKCGRKLSFFVSIILQVKQKKLVASKQILRALDLKSYARPCLEFSLAWFPTTGLLFSSGWWWVRWRWSSCIDKIDDSDDESGLGGSHHQWSVSCRLCSCHGDGRTSVQVLFHHDVVCTCLDSVCNDKDTLKINPETVIHSAL